MIGALPRPVLRKILEGTGRFEVRLAEEFRGTGPETLAPYDVVLTPSEGASARRNWRSYLNDTAPPLCR